MVDCWSRRRVLAAGAALGAVPIAGCGALDTASRSPLPVEISNFTTETEYLDVEIVRREAEDLSEATVLRESYELAARESEEEPYTVPDLPTVPNRRCLVRAGIGGTRYPTRHYHYVPDCVGRADHDDRLYVAVVPTQNGAGVVFDQNGCR